MCGENSLLAVNQFNYPGSPPHVRGKREDTFTAEDAGRITPACAGKTDVGADATRYNEDHPRMCGENIVIGVANPWVVGSPPHVRGKQHF